MENMKFDKSMRAFKAVKKLGIHKASVMAKEIESNPSLCSRTIEKEH